MTNLSSWNDKSTTSENDKSTAAQFLPAGGARAVYRLLARDTHTKSHYFALFCFRSSAWSCRLLFCHFLSSIIYLFIIVCCITKYSDDDQSSMTIGMTLMKIWAMKIQCAHDSDYDRWQRHRGVSVDL